VPADATPKRNLVFCRVGDGSLHRTWIGDPATRSYDVWLDSYAEDDARWAGEPARVTVDRGTVKIPRIARLLRESADELDRYDAIWFPDDDLALTPADVDRLFAAFRALGLSLAQPALRAGSHYAHAITLESRAFFARYTNFVEPMAPLFSREALRACAPTFSESVSGWGMDLVWPKLLGDPRDRIAIVDAVAVLHTRPIATSAWYERLHVDPGEEKRAMAARHGVVLPHHLVHYGGIPREAGPDPAAVIPPGLRFAARVVRGAPRQAWPVRRFWNRHLQAIVHGRRALARRAA
jgi:hypothetical protein